MKKEYTYYVDVKFLGEMQEQNKWKDGDREGCTLVQPKVGEAHGAFDDLETAEAYVDQEMKKCGGVGVIGGILKGTYSTVYFGEKMRI